MPKQSLKLRNSKKILASAAALSLMVCATPAFANEASLNEESTGAAVVESTEDVPVTPNIVPDDYVYPGYPGNVADPDAGQPAEGGEDYAEEGPVLSMPTVDKHGNTAYEQGKVDPEAGKPAEEGFGPLGPVTPSLDANIGNKKVKAQKTVKYTNPKTGDSSVLGYAGIGLVSVAGLFRKRK